MGESSGVGNDEVAALGYACPEDDLIIVTSWGYAIRFSASEVPYQQAYAAGARAVRLGDGEVPVALVVVDQRGSTGDLVVVTASGQAKRTALVEYRTQGRGGVGVHTSSVGGLIAACVADVGDDVILLSKRGKVARLHVADVPQQGRATAGSYLIRLDGDDQLISALAVPGNRR